MRNLKLEPILNRFWQWISSFQILESSRLRKVISYALNNGIGLINLLLDVRWATSNNLAECSIRPTTVDRKNSIFLVSLYFVITSGVGYSLVATAKKWNRSYKIF